MNWKSRYKTIIQAVAKKLKVLLPTVPLFLVAIFSVALITGGPPGATRTIEAEKCFVVDADGRTKIVLQSLSGGVPNIGSVSV